MPSGRGAGLPQRLLADSGRAAGRQAFDQEPIGNPVPRADLARRCLGAHRAKKRILLVMPALQGGLGIVKKLIMTKAR